MANIVELNKFSKILVNSSIKKICDHHNDEQGTALSKQPSNTLKD